MSEKKNKDGLTIGRALTSKEVRDHNLAMRKASKGKPAAKKVAKKVTKKAAK